MEGLKRNIVIMDFSGIYQEEQFYEGEQISCDEGELEWISIDQVPSLNIWEGDRIFFRLLKENRDFFSLKLVYDGKDGLLEAVLDGKPIFAPRGGRG